MKYIVHYGEIGTKGKNRYMFERQLIENIKKKIPDAVVENRYGRFLVTTKKKSKETEVKLKQIFGISFFSTVTESPLSFASIATKAVTLAKTLKVKTFKVETRRSNKQFPMNSMEVSMKVGEAILKKTRLKVDIHNPHATIYIEIAGKKAYIYTGKEQGLGGLPVGVTGKVICLLSGGIDSPVAAYYMMKRGCKVIFLHFYPSTATKRQIQEKIGTLVKTISVYQNGYRLYMIPFTEVQNEIIKKVPAEYRMIVYRRMMLRIAEKLRRRENAKGFVTGDNLGQVASQTLDNLSVIYSASSVPVFHPLIGFDKQEIIKRAQEVGTFETSILPYQDCCTFVVAEHPQTRAKKEDVEGFEKGLALDDLVRQALTKRELQRGEQ